MASYIEVESGKRSDRPELAKALEAARKAKATLLIAKRSAHGSGALALLFRGRWPLT